jgi:hypothetical protein
MKIVLLGTLFLCTSVYASSALDFFKFKKQIKDVCLKKFIISSTEYKDLYRKLIDIQNALHNSSQCKSNKEKLHVCSKPKEWSQCPPQDEDLWIDYNVMKYAAELICKGESIYNYTLCSCSKYQPTWGLLDKELEEYRLSRKQKHEPMTYKNAKRLCSDFQSEIVSSDGVIKFSQDKITLSVSTNNIASLFCIPKKGLAPLHRGTPQ